MVAGAVSDATDWANPGVSQLWATTTTKMQIFGQKKQNSSVLHNTAADETAAVTDGKRGEGQKAIRQQNQVMRNDCASRQTDRQTVVYIFGGSDAGSWQRRRPTVSMSKWQPGSRTSTDNTSLLFPTAL